MQQLSNLITIFKNKLFRIPDYQRGYAWQIRQLKDFWEDYSGPGRLDHFIDGNKMAHD